MNENINPNKLPKSFSNFINNKIKISKKEQIINDENIKNQKLFFLKSKNIKLNSCLSLSHKKLDTFNIFSRNKNKYPKNIRLSKKLLLEQNSENSNDGNEKSLNNKLILSQIFPKLKYSYPQTVLNKNKTKTSIFSSNINETKRIKNDYKTIFSTKTIQLEEINKKILNNLKIENTKREKYKNLIENKFNFQLKRYNSKDEIIKLSLANIIKIKYSEKKDVLVNFLKKEFEIFHPLHNSDSYKKFKKENNTIKENK